MTKDIEELKARIVSLGSENRTLRTENDHLKREIESLKIKHGELPKKIPTPQEEEEKQKRHEKLELARIEKEKQKEKELREIEEIKTLNIALQKQIVLMQQH
jgi:regulator of replication initiation timing